MAGHFYKYDELSDSNILIKEGLFLCVDKARIEGGTHGADWYYLIHIVDHTGKLSYHRTDIKPDSSI